MKLYNTAKKEVMCRAGCRPLPVWSPQYSRHIFISTEITIDPKHNADYAKCLAYKTAPAVTRATLCDRLLYRLVNSRCLITQYKDLKHAQTGVF